MENNLERKSILRESWENTKRIMDGIMDALAVARPLVTNYSREKLKEYCETGIDIYEYRKNFPDGIVDF
jgi:hypothetical protein